MAAQSAAHLTTSNVDKPSIFELVASQSLDSTFYPALKKIATVSVFEVCLFPTFLSNFFLNLFAESFQYLGGINPERYQFLVKHYDEIFLALSAFTQHIYLKKHGKKVI